MPNQNAATVTRAHPSPGLGTASSSAELIADQHCSGDDDSLESFGKANGQQALSEVGVDRTGIW